MRPFLLLASRPEDEAADDEYAAFLRATGLDEPQLRRIRLEAGPLPPLDLDDVAGVFLGGGPFNSSDPAEGKSAVQRRVEAYVLDRTDLDLYGEHVAVEFVLRLRATERFADVDALIVQMALDVARSRAVLGVPSPA